MKDSKILKPGYNLWKMPKASRVKVIIDGENYFRILRETLKNATERVFILGWEIHSKMRLVRDEPNDGYPVALGDFLNVLVRTKPKLKINILQWDFAMIYALEREFLPVYHLDWKTHRRIRLVMDGNHAIGGSHHQKIVVVDDKVAFVGGLDLSKDRWDTREHLPSDPKRTNPWLKLYGPYHDAQISVEGEVATELGSMVRTRWWKATGETIPMVDTDKVSTPWLEDLIPDFENIHVAISRTYSQCEFYDETREVEHLYIDSIRNAEHLIYIENQFLTSDVVMKELEKRLQSNDCPEIVIVAPSKFTGWLEKPTMGNLIRRFVQRLNEADIHNRLLVLYPVSRGEKDIPIKVHAKLMIVDDVFIRIGSSNLTNRSMGLDSECDLAITAQDRLDAMETIRELRWSLMAEHLDIPKADIAQKENECGSMKKTVDKFIEKGKKRTLRPLDVQPLKDEELYDIIKIVADPEKSIHPSELIEHFLPKESGKSSSEFLWKFLPLLLILVALTAAWQWTPLNQFAQPEVIMSWIAEFQDSFTGFLAAITLFVIGGLFVAPVTAMIVACGLTFGPWLGFIYSLMGVIASSCVTYGVGVLLWRDALQRFAGKHLNRINRRLDSAGLPVIISIRLVPIAPFTIINVVAGSSRIKFRDYLLGTLIAMTPGILGLTVLADRFSVAVRKPTWVNVLLAIAIIIIFSSASFLIYRKFSNTTSSK